MDGLEIQIRFRHEGKWYYTLTFDGSDEQDAADIFKSLREEIIEIIEEGNDGDED